MTRLISRNSQTLAFMGRCPIKDHDDEFPGMSLPNLGEKAIHALRIHHFCGHAIQGAILGAHRGIFIDETPGRARGEPEGAMVRAPSKSGDLSCDQIWLRPGTSPAPESFFVLHSGGCQSFREFFLIFLRLRQAFRMFCIGLDLPPAMSCQ